MISYDPNWRESLWKHDPNPIKTIKDVLKDINILKLSEEEASLLFNGLAYEQACDEAIKAGVSLVVVTLGAKGCYYKRSNGESGSVPGFKMAAVDTTGAGDIFWGALLSRLCDENLSTMKTDDLKKYLIFANAAAALSTLKKGGISSIPSISAIQELLKTYN
jgi:fructokinase